MPTTRIAIDARILGKSTGTYARYLLKYLQKIDTSGYEFDVLLRRADLDIWMPSAENFHAVEAEHADFTFAEQLRFVQQLNRGNYDLVHFCMQQQPILYRGKKVSTFHDLTLLKWRNPAKNKFVFRAKQLAATFAFYTALKTANHIITPSKYSAEDVISFAKIPREKITVTYLAAEPEPLSSEVDTSIIPNSPFILYVGNFFSYKNVETIGIALNKILDKHPDLKLVLVGRLDDAGQQLQDIFQKNNFKNIIFTGYIPDSQRDALYNKAVAYVFPSLMEGFGLPGLEAMLHGLPVISSKATCLPEVYKDAAVYFDPSHPDELAEALDTVLTNPWLQKELSTKGKELLSSYSWRRTAEETFEVYKKALQG